MRWAGCARRRDIKRCVAVRKNDDKPLSVNFAISHDNAFQLAACIRNQSTCISVAVWTVWYNWVRIHKSLRVTPAMAANLTDTVWPWQTIVAKKDEVAPMPGRPKIYKKQQEQISNWDTYGHLGVLTARFHTPKCLKSLPIDHLLEIGYCAKNSETSCRQVTSKFSIEA